jgi:hypothetical protein
MQEETYEVVEDPTIEEVFASGSDEPIPVAKYLDANRREFSEIRQEHETAYLIHDPILRCAACHQVVVPRRHYESYRRYFKHRDGDGNCLYKTKGKASQRQIDAMRYNGQKEGLDHINLKGIVEHSLRQDSSFSKISVEDRWWGSNDERKWKKPDVAADHDGLRVAFEIQLSTTFLSVMAARRLFYLENGGLLVWIFKTVHKEEVRQFQDDIFYNNNSNIFVVDDETARLSEENRELTLRCHYVEPVIFEGRIVEEWREVLIPFSKLTRDRQNQRVYFFDFKEEEAKLKKDLQEAEDADLRRRFTEYWANLGLYAFDGPGRHGDWPAKWARIEADFAKREIPLLDRDLARFSCVVLSIYYGKCVGLKHVPGTLLQAANYVYDSCKDLLWYFGDLLERTGHYRQINEQDKASADKKRASGKEHNGWDKKWQIVTAVYRNNDPSYPQKRQLDGLYDFLMQK